MTTTTPSWTVLQHLDYVVNTFTDANMIGTNCVSTVALLERLKHHGIECKIEVGFLGIPLRNFCVRHMWCLVGGERLDPGVEINRRHFPQLFSSIAYVYSKTPMMPRIDIDTKQEKDLGIDLDRCFAEAASNYQKFVAKYLANMPHNVKTIYTKAVNGSTGRSHSPARNVNTPALRQSREAQTQTHHVDAVRTRLRREWRLKYGE